MYLLGAHLPDHKLVRIALTTFYGISYATARQLCARLSLHESAKVSSLSEAQINQLSAYLSAPSSIPARKAAPTSPNPDALLLTNQDAPSSLPLPPSQRPRASEDPLRSIVIESDLRRQHIANITHHRTVGTYVGRRHTMGLPVRGQRTRSNAQTAKKLNRIERRAYSTAMGKEAAQGSVTSLLADLVRLRFSGN